MSHLKLLESSWQTIPLTLEKGKEKNNVLETQLFIVVEIMPQNCLCFQNTIIHIFMIDFYTLR